MKIVVQEKVIHLIEKERLEYHSGREGHSFDYDISILDVASKERAIQIVEKLIDVYPYSDIRMNKPFIQPLTALAFEVVFSKDDFCPFTVETT